MNLWGLEVNRIVGWIILVVISVLLFVGYMYVIRFVRKYASGMMAGFILLLLALAMVIWPAYYLIGGNYTTPGAVLAGVAILMGCVSFVAGAYEIRSFGDF